MKVINTKTQKEYSKLMEILEKKGYKWLSGDKLTEFNYWSVYKEDTCIYIEKTRISYSYKGWFRSDYKIISFQKYMNQEHINQEKQEFKVGDEVKVISKTVPDYSQDAAMQIGRIGYIIKIYGDGSGSDSNNCLVVDNEKNSEGGNFFASRDLINLTNLTESRNQKGKKMNILTNKLKRLFNKDLQTLYKAGYIDECGDLTSEGREELDFILRDDNMEKLVASAENKIEEEKENK